MSSVYAQLVVSGIAMGFIYALVAIEYTLIWNSTGLLNFSHEKIIMTGAYIYAGTYVLDLMFSSIPALIASVITMMIFGMFVAMAIFIPLRNKSTICAAMGCIMLGRVLVECSRLIWGAQAFTLKRFISGHVRLWTLTISKAHLVIITVAVVILVALLLFMRYTRIGKAMRCVQQNKTAAALMGIYVELNMAITIGMSFVICGIIGICIIPLYSIEATMANTIGLKGFSAGIVGGFGNLAGAIVGGLFIGILENISVMIMPSIFKDVISFGVLILFLLFKPNGILGREDSKVR